MRVIFMGTPDFSVGTLEALIEAGHDVCLAVTQPDKPKGRGKDMQFSPVKETALRHGIPVFQPRRIREPESVEELRKYNADVMVVIAFGQILPKTILEMTPYGCVNVHASLLPKYRGAAPIQWSIIEGETVTGVTTMQMDEGVDTGDMILKKQSESPTAYAKMLTKEMGNIDWAQSAVQIERLIRGLNSWPSAYTHWNGKVLKIWRAKAEAGAKRSAESGAGPAQPGTVVSVGKEEFAIQTGEGVLYVYEVQIPGKKRMETGAFLRGYTMEPGTVLTGE